jgi:hypothetical protein
MFRGTVDALGFVCCINGWRILPGPLGSLISHRITKKKENEIESRKIRHS